MGLTGTPRSTRSATRLIWLGLLVLILIVLGFAVFRVITDGPNVARGVVPDDPYESRYAEHPLVAYLHIVPGVVYLVGAPFQLSRRFRESNIDRHRRLGRILLPAGLLTGVFALAFGLPYAFGGRPEATATAVFGAWFLGCLVLAFRAIRGGDVTRHRRWMIRAFATGLAVGTIRVWVGIFQGFQILSLEDSFGLAFWLAFGLHALAAEVYLSRRPTPDGVPAGRAAG